jgi:hypothetical protein
MENGMRSWLLMLLLSISPGLVFAGEADPPPSDEQPPAGPESYYYDPINESFTYSPIVTQPPQVNPSPNPVNTGDEIVTVVYTDAVGDPYSVQANLTKQIVKIFNESGALVGSQAMTLAEIAEFRRAGQDTAPVVAQCGVLCEGVVAAIVAIVIGYTEYQDYRDCKRDHARAMNDQVNQALSCARSGGTYVVTQFPQPELCGAGGYGYCTK